MISYEIIKEKPEVQFRYPYHAPQQQSPYHQRMGLFERRRIERLNEQNKTPPVFDLRPWKAEQTGNSGKRLPFTDELVTALRAKGEYRPNPPGTVPIAMGKLQYAQWLNTYVYPMFRKHQLVTFRTIPIVLNTVPEQWFVILDLQEMHHWVQVDKETREPKAIGIAFAGETIPSYYPPCLIRGLVQSEIEAIDKLRNQASNERNLEATANTGTDPVAVDRSTGEESFEES